MDKTVARIPVILGLAILSACTTSPTQENIGMVIGGTLGGLLGAQVEGDNERTAAIIAGTLVGAAVGGSIGRSMDQTDRLKTAQTLETVRTGVSSSWQNPDSGYRYAVTPTRTYETASGPCREYSVQAVIGGKAETVYGTACRQPDGTWRAVQ